MSKAAAYLLRRFWGRALASVITSNGAPSVSITLAAPTTMPRVGFTFDIYTLPRSVRTTWQRLCAAAGYSLCA